ncbi:hypothetical protein [Pontibacter ruber]|uniref:Uncharacterized protein n=1 Tax=Pontibacter ruber TaxID=1343895 RepID=A0ABW5D015_9BACT|nr:hypothetical protein [Pontibacter ruber]
MEENLPLRKRHYRVVDELINEAQQQIPEAGMRRRAIAMSFLHEYKSHPVQPSLVPSADGTLEGILFSLPAYAMEGEDNPLWKVYQDLLLKLPSHTQLYMLVHEPVADKLEQWLQENKLIDRAHLHRVPTVYNMFIWAEDSFEVVQDKANGKRYMVQPHSHRRIFDDYISRLTARAFELERLKVPLYYEGGNILIGDDFFLMGADYAVDTLLDLNGVQGSLLETSALDALTRLYKKYLDKDRKLYFIGSSLIIPSERNRTFTHDGQEWTETIYTKNGEGTVQPMFHIDKFITLAGRNKAGKYQVLVGDTRMADELLGTSTARLSMYDVFDDIAELLSGLGFEVYRNPLPITYVDDEEERVRKWYFATSNNAVVEIRNKQEKTVWLPTYGHGDWEDLKKTDDENKRIWEELGFKVVQLEDFHPFVENSGALHCIKKYLKRGH